MRYLALMPVALLTVACGRAPGFFPVPPQQSLELGADPGGVAALIKMDDPAAQDYIVRDIGNEPGAFRWAFLHPELRFRVRQSAGLTFTAQVAVPEVTFKVTGPVNVSYAVNGKPLGLLRCDHPGEYEIRKPVPADWIDPGEYVRVTFDADRHWVSPEDGAQLSFLLFQAGFTQ